MATTNIKTMKELIDTTAAPTGNNLQTFYPKTHEKAVVDDNGNTLDSKLADIIEDAEDAATAAANVVKAQCEDIKDAMDTELAASDMVYDISANHLTEGNPTKYADLTAALGNGGANIPQNYRKPGMTVKFIQSSDNNSTQYVQYRYIGTSTAMADFTNVANWQGVDDEPTAGSENLVKSGGVADVNGACVVEVNLLPNPSATTPFVNLRVDRAPIELTIDVLENTASFAESVWLGLKILKDGGTILYENLTEDNGKFYYKVTNEDYLDSTAFSIFARKCTVAGTLKIRVNTNNGKATLIKRISDLELDLESNESDIALIEKVLPKSNGWEDVTDDKEFELINPYGGQYVGARLSSGDIHEASYEGALITNVIPIIEGARYKLKTTVRKLFDGIAYYSNIDALPQHYLGNDIFHKDDSTPEVIEAELTIPPTAVCFRLATFNYNTAFEIDTIYPYGLVHIAKKTDVDSISDALPQYNGWRKLEGSVYDLRNTQQTVGTRLTNGIALDSAYQGSLITGWIPIEAGKRYKLKTVVRNLFDGVAYYSEDDEETYIGHDVFHKDDSSPEVIEATLTIPENARYMRCATFNQDTAYELSEYIEKEYLPVASERFVQEQLEEYTPSTEYINSLIDAKNEPIEEDIDYLYGVVSAGSTPPELAVRYVPTIQLFLGSDILDISDVTYDSNFWTVVDNLPKYLGGTGGGQSKTFRFNAATVDEARYLCDIVTLTQDSAYENLFYLRIGNGPLIDTYNGGRTTFGGLVSDGGYFEIVPYGTKAFDVTSITLKPLVNSENDPDYTQTRNLPVNNVDAGNSARTLIDGKWNVAVGPTGETMASNVSGSRSIAIGLNALKQWKYGLQNVAIGTFAMSLLEEGNHNIAIGGDCMWQCKKAQDNVVIGKGALAKTGEYAEMLDNVAIGFASMGNQHSSSRDSVSVGYRSNFYGAAYSVFVGSGSGTTLANKGITNAIAIGYNAYATKSNQCVLGNASVSEFVLGNKKLIFNQDGTVSWEAIS